MHNHSLAVMQPYFFPYLGYFSLISSVDEFIFFDTVQFHKKSWMTRNRLININDGKTFYIRPELKNATNRTTLSSIELNGITWKSKMLDQVNLYKRSSRYFKEVQNMLIEILSFDYDFLADFNIRSLIHISQKLNLDNHFEVFSELKMSFEENPVAGTWGLEIAKKKNAGVYINAPGGEDFIFPKGFTEAGIKLGFIQPKLKEYNQKVDTFISGLSIIDVLMHNGFEKTSAMVRDYSIKWMN